MSTTPLSGIIADRQKAEAASKEARIAARTSKLAELAHARQGETLRVAGFGMMRLEIVGSRDQQEIEATVQRIMRERGIALDRATSTVYELERAIHTLAIGARDPDDPRSPYGSLAEWEAINSDMILAAWDAYGDVRQRQDPIAVPLTDDERADIEIAVKKKAPLLLRTFGLVKLCDWLTTTDVLPSTSPSPTSPSGESSSAS